MTAQPAWSDSGQGDLLELVARGPLAPDTADHEWEFYLRALKFAAVADDGVVSPNTLRAIVRGKVAPKRIGAFTSRAIRQGLIVADGYEISDDTQGGNAGRPMRRYRWIGGAS